MAIPNLMQEGDFRGWSDADADLRSATSKRIDRFTDAGLDLNGNTFGMLPSTLQAEKVSAKAGGNSDGLQLKVKMSPSLINHFKTVLGPDSNVIHLLSDGDTDGSLAPPQGELNLKNFLWGSFGILNRLSA